MKERVQKSMEELALPEAADPEMQVEPSEKAEKKKTSLLRLLSPNERPLKISFINEKTPQASEWAYAHDMGRKYLENS